MPNLPVNNEGQLYLTGCTQTWEANTDRNLVVVSTGQVRSDDNTNDINVDTALTLNISNRGVNGLDTGVPLAFRWYEVFVIGDSTGFKSAAGLFALSGSTPILPSGYDIKRCVGFVRSNAGGGFEKFYQRGAGKDRIIYTNQSVFGGVGPGAYTDLNLAPFLPSISSGMISGTLIITPVAPGDYVQFALPLAPGLSVSGDVAAVPSRHYVRIPFGPLSGVPGSDPSIQYFMTGGSSADFTINEIEITC